MLAWSFALRGCVITWSRAQLVCVLTCLLAWCAFVIECLRACGACWAVCVVTCLHARRACMLLCSHSWSTWGVFVITCLAYSRAYMFTCFACLLVFARFVFTCLTCLLCLSTLRSYKLEYFFGIVFPIFFQFEKLILFRMGFFEDAHGGISYNDETWNSYILPKENSKDVWIMWHIPWALLTSEFFHWKAENFAIKRSTDISCILIHKGILK